jgi:hypothetical protein
MPKKLVVVLNDEQRDRRWKLIRRRRESVCKLRLIKRAYILLKADAAAGTASKAKVVTVALGTSVRPSERVRRCVVGPNPSVGSSARSEQGWW